ncbi:MAG: murein hydrolase activator EnvC family protein [Actinomycetota bacterium]
MPHRPRFLFRCLALALVLGVTAAPALAGPAGGAGALDQAKQELAAIRKRIAQARGEAAGIRRQVSALDAQIAKMSKQIRGGERDIKGLESEMRSAEQTIGELEQQLRAARRSSNERARRLYRSGPADLLSTLLSARSVGEFVRALTLSEVVAEIDGKTMIEASRLRGDLAERKEDLSKLRANLQGKKTGLEARRELLESARASRENALAAVQQRIAADERHERDLERAAQDLTARLRSSSLSRSASGAVSRAGLVWPLNGAVTSGWGRRRGGFHYGIDIDGNTGDPIRAAKSGTVANIDCGSGYGICSIIDHGGGLATLYAHMSRRAVSSGSVDQGQVIGYVGCTGSCSGSHLHFEVRVNGDPQNPRGFLPYA